MTVILAVTCIRCHQERWPLHPKPGPYTCQRCTEAVAGGTAIDPLPSAKQAAARAAGGRLLRATRHGKAPGR
jgi:hypothetical protein